MVMVESTQKNLMVMMLLMLKLVEVVEELQSW